MRARGTNISAFASYLGLWCGSKTGRWRHSRLSSGRHSRIKDKARIRGRGRQAPDRRAQRYLENFDAIWCLQEHLLSEADRTQTPILANDDRERTIQQAMDIIIDALAGDSVAGTETSPQPVEDASKRAPEDTAAQTP